MEDEITMDQMEMVLDEGAVHPEIVQAMKKEEQQKTQTASGEGKEQTPESTPAESINQAFQMNGKDFVDEDAALDHLLSTYPAAPLPAAPVQAAPAPVQPAPVAAQPAGFEEYSSDGDQRLEQALHETRRINEENRQLLQQNKEMNQQMSDKALKDQFWSEFYGRNKDLKGHSVLVSGVVDKYRAKVSKINNSYAAQQFIAQATRTYLKRQDRLAPIKSEIVSQRTSAQIPEGASSSTPSSVRTATMKKTDEKHLTLAELMKRNQRKMKAAYNPTLSVAQQEA